MHFSPIEQVLWLKDSVGKFMTYKWGTRYSKMAKLPCPLDTWTFVLRVVGSVYV